MHKHPKFTEEFNKISKLYTEESDRAAAILAASYAEKVLEDWLKKILVDDKKIKNLFSGYGPLATFSAKVDILFALGLLSKEMKSDFDLIRKIRNHFAHHPSEISFNDHNITQLCSKLSAPLFSEKNSTGTNNFRIKYISAIGKNIAMLSTFICGIKKRNIPNTEGFWEATS